MKLKKLSLHIKIGLILALLYIILYLFLNKVHFVMIIYVLYIILPLIFLRFSGLNLGGMNFLLSNGEATLLPIPSVTGIIFCIIIWFLIGMLIGYLIKRKKSRK